jgi:hypothetical protein
MQSFLSLNSTNTHQIKLIYINSAIKTAQPPKKGKLLTQVGQPLQKYQASLHQLAEVDR